MKVEINVLQVAIIMFSVMLEGQRFLKLDLPSIADVLKLIVSDHLEIDLEGETPLIEIVLIAPELFEWSKIDHQ